MKKAFFVFQLFLVTGFLFSRGGSEPLRIKLNDAFRLNPITGINGDQYEANSKFVQRMIFSSLVFPLADPYLQDDYPIALDLSLIDGLEYRDSYGSWINYDMRNYEAYPGQPAQFYRVRLRSNLMFYKAGQRREYDTLTVEDVVYSYRNARITMDRVYDKRSGARLKLNTLLYSKIRSFNDVYCESNISPYVYFRMDSNKTCKEFLELLVYVPILSSKQIHSESPKRSGSPEYRAIHGYLDFVLLANHIWQPEYDLYDINKLLFDSNGRVNTRGIDFFRNPVGYGQFLIDSTIPDSGGSTDPDLWRNITLVKNAEWCNFSGESHKQIGSQIIIHKEYCNSNEKIILEKKFDMDFRTELEGLLNVPGVLYNIPLTANLFQGSSVGLYGSALTAGKRKMQISHSLYGLYFGPAINSNEIAPLFIGAREFFASFADRVRIENLAKYVTGEGDWSTFDAQINQETDTLVSDLQMQKLYYPFYTGRRDITGVVGSRSEIGLYYDRLEEADLLYQEYIYELGKRDLREYYRLLGDDLRQRNNFYQNYVGGADFPSSIQGDMVNMFNAVRRYILYDNRVNIEICYSRGDHIGKTIADHFARTLAAFFSGIRIECSPVLWELGDYGEWYNRATANSTMNRLSFLVKGWNYKFDLLDELNGQFIDPLSLAYIENQYREFVENSVLDAETTYYRIARRFVDDTVMIPLLGIQNYSVFSRGAFPALEETNQDIEILLLPYYWRKK